jgi:hypothetical protein
MAAGGRSRPVAGTYGVLRERCDIRQLEQDLGL